MVRQEGAKPILTSAAGSVVSPCGRPPTTCQQLLLLVRLSKSGWAEGSTGPPWWSLTQGTETFLVRNTNFTEEQQASFRSCCLILVDINSSWPCIGRFWFSLFLFCFQCWPGFSILIFNYIQWKSTFFVSEVCSLSPQVRPGLSLLYHVLATFA